MKSRVVMLIVTAVLLVTMTGEAAAARTVLANHLWWPQAKLTARDGANGSEFGWSVALDGDTALVSAPFDNTSYGSVYVFTHVNDVWGQQAKLTANNGAVNDWFGNAVAVDGDTALVGNPGDDASAGVTYVNQGSVYVFTRTDGIWRQQAILIASDGAANDFFGSAVALDGDTALVGTYSHDASMGSAYVFTRANGIWTQQAELTASDRIANDFFGISVALSGNSALIGAHGGNAGRGAAYLFTRTGATWSQQAKLAASDGAASDQFGCSVALNGDTALVGALGNDGAYYNQGAAYIFTRTNAAWSQQAKLTASDAMDVSLFGRSTALDGNTALVGAFGDNSSMGAAYLFTRNGATWSQAQKLGAEDLAVFDRFGYSAALSGGTALVGSLNSDGVTVSTGAVYVFSTSHKLTWLPMVSKQ